MKKDLMNKLRMVENGGNIVVNDEVAVHRVKLLEKIKRQMMECVMHVEPSTLLTTREMFYMMGIKGYSIKYYRIPVIENHPPSIVGLCISRDPQESLSEIVGIMVTNSNSKSIVFSDMTGRNKSIFCAYVAILVRVRER